MASDHDHAIEDRDGGEYGAKMDATPVIRPSSEVDLGDTILELDGVTKSYGPETAVEDLSLSVREGELLTLVGPSGCGKTTTLRLLAGLERPTDGEIRLAGESIAGPNEFVAPEDRNVGLVFQDYALFPHLTVAENVGFGLDDRSSSERAERVEELLDLVSLSEFGDRKPDQLSGGQQQRVALARSLAPEPNVLLLDEPFSNLDVRLRVKMRQEVRSILKEAGVTAISVTHDQEEAMSISDRVAVVCDGRLEQVGSPSAVFEHPESRFVASFLGHASFVTAMVRGERLDTPIGSFGTDLVKGPVSEYDGAAIDVLIRPDDLRLTPENEASSDGVIRRRQYHGPSFIYVVELDDGELVRCLHNHAEVHDPGTHVCVDLVADHSLAWYPPATH